MASNLATDHDAVYSVLTAHRLQGRGAVPIAVLLLVRDRLYIRLREDLRDVVDPQVVEVLEGYPEMIAERIRDESAGVVFEMLANTLSNYVTMSDRRHLANCTPDAESVLTALFQEHVRPR
jgi:hypothetical protein